MDAAARRRVRYEGAWAPGEFAARVVAWQHNHGRHDLPWQQTRDPYRVWLAEVMLQQTQVATVAPYYARFLQRFPDVNALALASEDEVLALWSGLGYYARARHLHACARQVSGELDGRFPATARELAELPGMGRSTAAAVAAFCFGERAAILDGNVRRVLARVFGIADDFSRAAPLAALWRLAESLLPVAEAAMPAYTQGLMDLGATVCLPRSPRCDACPLRDRCVAARSGVPERYPAPRRPLPRPKVTIWLLEAADPAGRIWLVRRPGRGIWARLYCLPAFPGRGDLLAVLPATAQARWVEHAPVEHVLTHRKLEIHFITARLAAGGMASPDGGWFDAHAWPRLGLPAPVRRFLERRIHAPIEVASSSR